MTIHEIESLVRDVITHYGLPVTIASVAPSPVGWEIRVRGDGGRIVAFTLYSGRPAAMRVSIEEHLDAIVS